MQPLKEILFIDIETVPAQPTYQLMEPAMQAEWDKKARLVKASADVVAEPAAVYGERAGIFSEFAKIVCIGIGSLQVVDNTWQMRLKALVHDDEHRLLTEFITLLSKFLAVAGNVRFCGHNIKEFDIPFICRRMVINRLPLPDCMQLSGKKPWEVTHLDTLEMWRFGDHKNFTSLSLLAGVLGMPSPKTDMDGSQVSPAYWQQHDLERIGRYCLQDVLTSARVYLRLAGINLEFDPVFVP